MNWLACMFSIYFGLYEFCSVLDIYMLLASFYMFCYIFFFKDLIDFCWDWWIFFCVQESFGLLDFFCMRILFYDLWNGTLKFKFEKRKKCSIIWKKLNEVVESFRKTCHILQKLNGIAKICLKSCTKSTMKSFTNSCKKSGMKQCISKI